MLRASAKYKVLNEYQIKSSASSTQSKNSIYFVIGERYRV